MKTFQKIIKNDQFSSTVRCESSFTKFKSLLNKKKRNILFDVFSISPITLQISKYHTSFFRLTALNANHHINNANIFNKSQIFGTMWNLMIVGFPLINYYWKINKSMQREAWSLVTYGSSIKFSVYWGIYQNLICAVSIFCHCSVNIEHIQKTSWISWSKRTPKVNRLWILSLE